MKRKLITSQTRFFIIVFLFFTLNGCGGGGSAVENTASSLSEVVVGHIDRLNKIRYEVGLGPLTWDARLARAAQAHANYLTINGSLGHGEDPLKAGFTGLGFYERALREGYSNAMGETVIHGNAATYEDGAAYLDALLYSPGHRAFLLASDLNEYGVGGVPLTTVLGRSNGYRSVVAVSFPYNGQEKVYTSVVLSISGALFSRVNVKEFQLVEEVDGIPVEVHPWASDNTGAVLFQPKKQLKFSTWYKATVNGTLDGLLVNNTVRFKTN